MRKNRFESFACCLVALAAFGLSAPSWGDQIVNANETVVLSDDIYETTTTVIHEGEEGDPDGNNNRSGLADGTNPNQGNADGNNNGTNNPNNAR